MPASCARHQASSGASRSAESCRRCHAARSAGCTASSGRGFGLPSTNAA